MVNPTPVGKPLPTINPVASFINDIIGGSESLLLTTVENAIIAWQPWLGFPILDLIWEIPLSMLFGSMAKMFKLAGVTLVVDTQVAIEESNLSDAVQKLIAAEKTGDPKQIAEAIQNYANANSALIHYDGAAPIN